jgi:N-acetylglucosaminyldiphosphoundecaprenol N-acetyl-beta-D-mannosaminyltransferase
MNILGYTISTLYPLWPVTGQTIINTINPHSFCVAQKDATFSTALKTAHYLIPDGTGIVLAAKVLHGKTIPRITGADMHQHLLEEAQKHGLRVFYLGASDKTLLLIKVKIASLYPAITVASFSPPYKDVFSNEDNRQMQEQVNNFAPHILFVGMTAPKQEKWVLANKDHLNANIICSIGAVFGFFAGTTKRPGKFWQKAGLEWLPRLLREPRRLWRRTFISTPQFLWYLLKAKLSNQQA